MLLDVSCISFDPGCWRMGCLEQINIDYIDKGSFLHSVFRQSIHHLGVSLLVSDPQRFCSRLAIFSWTRDMRIQGIA